MAEENWIDLTMLGSAYEEQIDVNSPTGARRHRPRHPEPGQFFVTAPWKSGPPPAIKVTHPTCNVPGCTVPAPSDVMATFTPEGGMSAPFWLCPAHAAKMLADGQINIEVKIGDTTYGAIVGMPTNG